MEGYLTTEQVAKMFHVKASCIRAKARARLIPCFKFGRDYRFIPEDIEEYARSLYPSKWRAQKGEPCYIAEAISGTSILPEKAASQLDAALEQLTGKKRKNSTTSSRTKPGKLNG